MNKPKKLPFDPRYSSTWSCPTCGNEYASDDSPEICNRIAESIDYESRAEALAEACKAALACEYGAPWDDALIDIRKALAAYKEAKQ